MTSVLAIDSVSDAIAVAFEEEGREPVLRVHTGAQEHSQALLRLIDEVCSGHRERIQAIVVVRGPGAYTGVRVGIATAQGLGLALNVPVQGVDTLAAVATAARADGVRGTIEAIHPAGRGDFAVQAVSEHDDAGEMRLAPGAELRGPALAGEGAGDLGGTEIGAELRCKAAIDLFRAGRTVSAEALYVREPHVTLARKTPIGGLVNAGPSTPTED